MSQTCEVKAGTYKASGGGQVTVAKIVGGMTAIEVTADGAATQRVVFNENGYHVDTTPPAAVDNVRRTMPAPAADDGGDFESVEPEEPAPAPPRTGFGRRFA